MFRSETCFLCLNKVVPVTKVGRGRPSSAKVQVSSQGPKILLNYLLDTLNSKSVTRNCENDILIAYKSGRLKLCHKCESCAEKITQLHLQLEAHQLKIIDLLKRIQHCLQKSTRIQGSKVRWEESRTGGAGGFSLEMLQVEIHRNFLARKLSDGHEVRLERLENLRIRKCAETTNVEPVVKEEPEDPVDFIGFDSPPPPSSPVNHENFEEFPLIPSPVAEAPAPLPKRSSTVKVVRNKPSKSSSHKRLNRYFYNWAPSKKRKVACEPRPVNEGIFSDYPPLPTTEDPLGEKSSTSEVAGADVKSSESKKYTLRRRGRLKKKLDGYNWTPKPKATYKRDNDFDDENDPIEDVFDDDYDPSSNEELSDYEPELDKEPKAPRKKKKPSTKQKYVRRRNRPPKTRWTCDICLELVPFPQMQDHLQAHPQFEKFYFCNSTQIRKKVFGTFKGYVWHLLEPQCCKSASSMACEVCPDRKAFPPKDLPKHLYEDHKLDHPRPTCPDCFESFYDLRTLRKHKVIEHERRFVCEYCSKVFDYKSSLEKHIMNRHLRGSEKRFQCAFCPARFCTANNVRYHEQKVHTKETLTPCPHCGKEMIRAYLNAHIKRAHDEREKFSCKLCPKKFSTQSHLKRHEDAHSGELKYKCSHCSYAATTRTSLQRHVQIHGERKFGCDYCFKRFTLKRYLEDHVRTHTKEKPFQCDICSMAFNARNSLSAHRKKAHGVTPRARSLFEREPSTVAHAATERDNSSTATLQESEHVDFKQEGCIVREHFMVITSDIPGQEAFFVPQVNPGSSNE